MSENQEDKELENEPIPKNPETIRTVLHTLTTTSRHITELKVLANILGKKDKETVKDIKLLIAEEEMLCGKLAEKIEEKIKNG